jgi:hypothetical protein
MGSSQNNLSRLNDGIFFEYRIDQAIMNDSLMREFF